MDNNIVYKKDGIVYFNKNVLPRKWLVLKRMGVKRNSFAGDVISRLYDYYFSGAIDLNNDFRKYYRKEYASIIDYMEQHHNICYDDAVFMAKGSYSMKNCSQNSVERNIETVNYVKDIKEAFAKAVGGFIDEDSDGIYYE